MGWILGIHLGHDASVALLRDGVPLFCISEERLAREKGYCGFPLRALNAALKTFGVDPGELEQVAMDTPSLPQVLGPGEMAYRLRTGAARHATGRVQAAGAFLSYFLGKPGVATQEANEAAARRLMDVRLREVGLPLDRVRYYDHHHCHAVGAFDTSPFERALFVTSDARGDGNSATIGTASDAGLRRRAAVSELDSIGQFYGAVTAFLGFRPNRHEGKITGLAAFGDPAVLGPEFLRNLTWNADGTYSFRLPARYRVSSPQGVRDFLRSLRAPLKDRMMLHAQQHVSALLYKGNWLGMLAYLRDVAADAKPADVAAAVQLLAEEAMRGLVRNHLPAGGPVPVVASGGVFANVKINQVVAELPGVERLYVQPAMGDEGLSVGAALAAHRELTGHAAPHAHPAKQGSVGHTYLGSDYSEKEVLAACEAEGVTARRMDALPGHIARWIDQGLFVGLFRGRMEFGPRALGHRSILARATDPEVSGELNRRLNRSDFMPFAPSMLAEHAPTWLDQYDDAHVAGEYMTVAYRVEPSRAGRIAAAVHVDGTARPQIVRAEVEPTFHEILTEYHRISGVPAVVNTSFNMHEEPIVCTPRDAVRTFKAGAVDVLVLDNLVVYRGPEPGSQP